MRTLIRTLFALALLCAALSTAAFASSIYFVQGIPGRDFATETDPAFPVDILLNDEVCYQHGLPFGNISGPVTLAPGTYNVKISIADTLAPCSNSPLIDTSVTLEARQDISAVMALTSTGTPTLLTYVNSFAPVAANVGRLLFAQSADATLQIILQNTTTQKLSVYTVKRGVLLDVNLPAGDYTVEINQGTTTLVASTKVTLSSQSATLLYTLGEATNNTVSLATRTIRDVI